MSIPGEQPNPYAQPPANPYGNVPPQPAGGQPPGQQSGQAPNPYAYPPTPGGMQPGQQGQQAGPGQVPAGYPGQVPGGYGPGAPAPGAPAAGGKGRGPLWAVGGAVVASAVWAGVLFATGGFGDDDPKPELGGYAFTGNLCKITEYAPIEAAGFTKEASSSTRENPQANGTEDEALDSMDCNTDFEPSGSSSGYSSTWLATSARLHRKTDPTAEFGPQYRAYKNQKSSSYSYKVNEVVGIGDEAYLVTQVDKDGKDEGKYVILGIRDGWMTYQTSWSNYTSSTSSTTPPDSAKVAEMLKESAKATMERLQKKAE
ncbi:hypothetical protein AAHZ94_23500 [Streptomyces sp. HSW2009]|uniref:hypothetical protein n=1 Tax=Streptomyces sp. HSW2009 TaxID=3142890 RepID=UPI0032EDBE2E